MKPGMLGRGQVVPSSGQNGFFEGESQSRHHSLKITKTAPTIMPNPMR